jgi:glycosyltransferase involved in cell wall biosynthesis
MYRVMYDYQIFSLQQFGGISRYFCELAARVARADGFSARIVAPIHFNDYLAVSKAPKIAGHLPLKVTRTGRLHRTINGLLVPAIWSIHPPNLVHRTYFSPTPRLRRAKSIVTVHDMIHELFPRDFPAGDPTSRNKKRCVQDADHIICISQSTKADLIRLFNVPAEKISVTHLAFSSAFAPTNGAPRVSGSGRPYLLYVGHRGGYKNFANALKAYASSKRLKNEFDFIAFGGAPFGAEEAALRRQLQLPESSVKYFTGNDADLAHAYRNARAFVYPSCYEGFGVPLLEAMSCGCPVSASSASSIPEVVGSAAESFDPQSVESMRTALETVCFDEPRRSELVRLGFERLKLFSWDRCATETTQVYRRVLETAA